MSEKELINKIKKHCEEVQGYTGQVCCYSEMEDILKLIKEDNMKGFNYEKSKQEADWIKEYLREEGGKKGLWILNEILNINKDRLSKRDLENGYKITRRIQERI